VPFALPRTSTKMCKRFIDSEVKSELEEARGRNSVG
jgi:hypothetical protein